MGGAPGLAASGLARKHSNGLNPCTRTPRALGADVTLVALHEDRATAEGATEDAFAELERIEEAMSLYRPHSQLCRLNRDGVLDRPDPRLVTVLRAAADVFERSDGAFDATVQPLWTLYADARKSGR